MAEPPDLRRLLAPASLAVVGDAQLGARVLGKTAQLGFAGPIWAVHPSGRVGDHEAFTSVSELPAGPDAAFVAVPAAITPTVIGDLAARGCGAAVVYSSGFAETGPAGRALQRELLDAAGGMPILGPNCYGLLNYVDGVAIWPDEHGGELLRGELLRGEVLGGEVLGGEVRGAVDASRGSGTRGVALVSQSSSIAISLTMQDIGLPLAHVLTVGNAAALGPWQLAQALTQRPEVSAVGLVVESLQDLRGIEALARSSRERAIPVVALVLGRSEQAQRVVVSHSASMASDAAVGADFLARCGIGQVDCVDSLLGALSLLHCGGPLTGRTLTSLSSSGGEAALIADACVEAGVGFADLAPGQREALAQALGPRVTLDNPLDYHTYVWGDLAAMREAFVAMTGGPGDLHLLFADIPREDRCDPRDWLTATQAFGQAVAQTGARGALVAAMASNLRGPRAADWVRDGLPVLAPVRVAIDAAQAAAAIGEAWTRPPAEPVHGRVATDAGDPAADVAGGAAMRVLDEPTAKAMLAAHGAPIPAGEVARSVEEAVTLAEALLAPVAQHARGATRSPGAPGPSRASGTAPASGTTRASGTPPGSRAAQESGAAQASEAAQASGAARPSADLPADAITARRALAVKGVGAAHKTDLDGVRLGLRTAHDVAEATRDLLDRFEAVLVEELVAEVVAELLVSVDVDPTFGPVLTLGWGGTRTELHADACRLVLPAPRGHLREALLRLRCAPLLTGYRGAPAGDLEATLDAVEAIVATATPTIGPPRTVEVNPLLVTPTAAWVADALVIEPDTTPAPEPDPPSHPTPGATSSSTPHPTSSSTSDPTSDQRPALTPDAMPDLTPDAMPDLTPDAMPDLPPDATSDGVPSHPPSGRAGGLTERAWLGLAGGARSEAEGAGW